MNPTTVLSFLSAAAFSAGAVVLIRQKRNAGLSGGVFLPLFLSVLLYDFIVLSNFLEHAGITAFFDPLEDIAEIVFTLVFLFFINNWRKDHSEARFRALFRQAPFPLAEVTREGRIEEVNDILAFTLQEFFGAAVEDVPTLGKWWELAYPDPAHREQAVSRWETDAALAYKTGAGIKPEEKEITCSDGTKRSLIIGASVIGENLVVSMVDITDRKRAEEEKEKLHALLVQSQKLEAVGVLAGGVAHDFNNMLGAIMGYAELTMEDMPPDHRFRENLAQILEAARRSIGLTRQLLTFARKQEVVPVIFDVNALVKTTLKMLQRLIGENIVLVWSPGDGSYMVNMDPTQFDQILANLCVNARDAIPDVGKITVETSAVLIRDNVYGLSHEDFSPGNYILVSVSDTGSGMNQETLEHIFEPFFTTKGVGKGSGLGLATVYGIVKQNHGMINVTSEPGQGTTFNIYLPHHRSEEASKTKAFAEEIVRSRGETILIVEDDPIVLEISSVMLHRLGYAVLRAQTPGEAIDIAETAAAIQMFITDMVMPEMNGRDLAHRLRMIRPGIRGLFMSGYTANIVTHEDTQDPDFKFIKKPFSIRDLADKIREVLDRG